MKNNILLLIVFVCSVISLNGQVTKGGSEKNYNEYHVIYDTIVTKTQVKIPFDKYNFSYFTIGYAMASSDSKKLPIDFWNRNTVDYNLYHPFTTGKIGLKNGIYMSWGNFSGINFINKNLIKDIDVGFEHNLDYYHAKVDWSPLSRDIPPNFGSYTESLYQKILLDDIASFNKIGYGFGLGVTYHTPVEDLDVRFSYMLNLSLVISSFKGSYYNETSTFDDGFGNIEYTDITYRGSLNGGDDISVGSFNQIKLSALYKSAYFGLTFNMQTAPINKSMYSSEDITISSISVYDTFSDDKYIISNYKLSHISIDIGLKF